MPTLQKLIHISDPADLMYELLKNETDQIHWTARKPNKDHFDEQRLEVFCATLHFTTPVGVEPPFLQPSMH